MSQLIFGGLLSTPAPTAPIVGIGFIVLFAIVGVMVGPDYDGMNAPAMDGSKETNKNWFFYREISKSTLKIVNRRFGLLTIFLRRWKFRKSLGWIGQ